MPSPRRLLLLRHGETSHNRDGIWQGHLDVPLSATGQGQAKAAGGALAAYGPVRIVSSDLARAARTADAVAAAGGLEVELDPRWREFDVGQWTGLSSAEVIARNPEERARALRGEEQRRGIDGEGPSQVAARVRPALHALIGSLGPGECGVVVSHGGTIRILSGLLLGIDPVTHTRLFAGPGNCQWADLVETDDPGLDTDDPGLETDDPGLETDDPGLETDDPGLETDDPGRWRLAGWNLRVGPAHSAGEIA